MGAVKTAAVKKPVGKKESAPVAMKGKPVKAAAGPVQAIAEAMDVQAAGREIAAKDFTAVLASAAKLAGGEMDPRVNDDVRTVDGMISLAAGRFMLYLPESEVPQDLLEQIKSLVELQSRLKGFTELAYRYITDHYVLQSPFEDGPVVVTAEETPGQCRPKWKDEAVETAAKLAQLTKKPFVEEAYVQEVQGKYPAKVTLSVDLVFKS